LTTKKKQDTLKFGDWGFLLLLQEKDASKWLPKSFEGYWRKQINQDEA